MKKMICLSLLVSLCFSQSKLVRISDGDTMIFDNVKMALVGNKRLNDVRCRIDGIDTPEKFDTQKLDKFINKYNLDKERIVKAGKLATRYAQITFDREKNIEVTALKQDVYKRELCRVTFDGFDYALAIVEDGYAVVYKNGRYIDSYNYKQKLLEAQKKAKKEKKGLWKNYADIMSAMSND